MNGDPEVDAPVMEATFLGSREDLKLSDVVLLAVNNKPRHAAVVATDGEIPLFVSKFGRNNVFMHALNHAAEYFKCDEISIPTSVKISHTSSISEDDEATFDMTAALFGRWQHVR